MSTPAGWHPDPEVYGQLRYWDGEQWTEHLAPAPVQPVVVQQQFPTRSYVDEPVKTNHILHALLTLFTCGLWFLVWGPVTAINRSRTRQRVTYYR